ncbi:MerR family transcriptional regulator [Novosphingobium terrae]|uniref:MerR family transcriptional regulator n=1 Tax=Novosphingobium terrae TaxID=2726189 RepID=UPI001F135138|nr:MerR family transcriptional regulator [Novosphingobium terrae]
MKMRDLEARTGVNRETIRVYLRHKLIPEPDRPCRNVADYSETHVQAILAIRQLQQESRLTLPQISAMMAGGAAQGPVGASAFDKLEQLVAHRAGADGPPVAIASLLDEYPHAEEDARILASIGILRIIETAGGDMLTLSAAQMVRIWGRMRQAGFDQHLDYAPDILGFYIEAADFVGRWEATTFLQRTQGRIEVEEAATMVERALPLMLDFFGLLRQQAFFRHFDTLRGAGAEP